MDTKIENDRILDLIFESTHTCIAYMDTSFNFIRVNTAYAEADGKRPEFFPGKNHFDLYPHADNEIIFRRVVQTGEPHFAYARPFAYENSPERGITHWDWTLHAVSDARGNIIGVILNLMDVTKRVSTEQALSAQSLFTDTVLQSASALVVVLDITGRVIRFNKACEKVTGFSAGEICGEYLWERLLTPEETAPVREVFRNITLSAIPSQHTNYWVSKSGEQRLIDWWNSAIVSPAGLVTNVVAVGIDITERNLAEQKLRQLNEELEQRVQQRTRDLRESVAQLMEEIKERTQAQEKLQIAKEEAEKANRLKSEFLRRMSHELRTPMNAILGFAQLIRQNEPQNSDFADEILTAGRHLLNLINEVLDLAKIESGKIDLRLTPANLQTIADQSIRLVRSEADKKSIILENELSKERPIILTTDKERLKEVLLNLLSNAVKYIPDGGRVKLWTQVLPCGVLRINVSDNGPGLSGAQIETIFEPFNRLGAEFSRIEGTGIGLTIAKQIMEHLRGNIGVNSEPGKGSTFWIDHPLGATAPALIDTAKEANACKQLESSAQTANQVACPATPPDRGSTVVYVEDNPANLRLVESVFRLRPKVRLLSANDAETGIKLIQGNKPRLIILDIDLPQMNGYQVLALLRADPVTAHVPVFALTAAAMASDIKKGREAGFKRYITKPIQVDEFLQCIDEELHHSQQ